MLNNLEEIDEATISLVHCVLHIPDVRRRTFELRRHQLLEMKNVVQEDFSGQSERIMDSRGSGGSPELGMWSYLASQTKPLLILALFARRCISLSQMLLLLSSRTTVKTM